MEIRNYHKSPSPDCSGNPFWAFSAQKDWERKAGKSFKKKFNCRVIEKFKLKDISKKIDNCVRV